MFNKKNEIRLSALVVSVILVASFFAISFVQQALAQGKIPNCPKCGASNTTSSGNSMSNPSTNGGPSTSGGQMTGNGY